MHAPVTAPDFKEGARDSVKLLESTLDRAQAGDIVHVCVVMTTDVGSLMVKTAGSANHQMQAFFGLSVLQDEIKGFLTSRRPPTQDRKLTADYACYNVAQAPCSYDFIAWLVEREMNRVAKGGPFPLKVYFHFGPNDDQEFAFQYARRKQMFENVLQPSLRFIGAVEDELAIGGMSDQDTFSMAPIVARVRKGEQVPQFKTGVCANHNGPKPVVITLRETTAAPGRNSNLEEWCKFGRWLRARGERVIFLRDTDKAAERLEDFELCPIASTDIDARLAMYLDAKCNLFVANGPSTLAWFTQAPWLVFNLGNTTDPDDYPSTPNGLRQYMGIGPGEQLPWCNDKQRIVWGEITFENMTAAWEAMWG